MSYDDWDDEPRTPSGVINREGFGRASRALSKFKTMQHSLTTYARAITGKPDLQIEASTEPGISQNKIKFMPPMELADERVHHVSYCDRRGEDGLQLCDACAADEAVMARIYHELAHVAFHSFDQPAGSYRAANGAQARYETFMDKAEKEHNENVKNVLMGFEDSRVNRQIFAARPGVRGMYEAMIINTVENGAEVTNLESTELVQWKDMSADFQIVLGMNLKMTGFDPSEWLHEEVVKDLDDEKLNEYMRAITRDNADVIDNYRSAVEVYKYLKTLGYFKDDEDDDEDDEPDEDEGGGEGDNEGEGEPSIQDVKGRPSPDSGCLADQIAPMSDEEKQAMAQMTENQTNDEMERAIVQAEHFEKPSVEIRGVKIIEYGSKPHWPTLRNADRIYKPAESLLGGALLKMRAAFEDNLRARNLKHLKAGKVNARVLGRRAAVEDPRLFRKKTIPAKKDYFVIIGMDLSGSTSDGAIYIEQKVVAAQAELLHRLNIPFAIIGHSGHYNILSGDGDSWRTEWDTDGGMNLFIFPIKTEQQNWDTAAKARLFATKPVGANLDGHALEYLRKRADESTSLQKIIIYGSDGAMPMENYEEELAILKRELKICKQKKHIVLGLGINTDSPTRHGLDTVIVRSDNDIQLVIRQLDKYIRTDY